MSDDEKLTQEERDGLRKQFEENRQCVHCGGLHLRACPRVRRIVFKKQDEIQEIEFWRDGYWPQEGIIWPEDVYDDGEVIEPAVPPVTEEAGDGEGSERREGQPPWPQAR